MPSHPGQAKPNGSAAGDLSWLEATAPPPDQPDIVAHLLPAGALVRLSGPPGTGKTMITHSLAFHVAAMGRWCGRETTNGFAFYVNPHGISGGTSPRSPSITGWS